MNDNTLEQRYAAIQAAAKEQGCEIHLSLVIGGVDVTELYRLRVFPPDPSDTLDKEIADMERSLADPRVRDAATASRRMHGAEATAKLANELVIARQKEYKVALAAMHSVTTDQPISVEVQEVIGMMVEMERDPRSVGQVLRDMLDNTQERTATDGEDVQNQG